MLINFTVANYTSFFEKQDFSMKAGKYSRLEDHIITYNSDRYLKCGVLFGANAAGKSNFIKAIQFSKDIVINGVRPGNILNKHFRINHSAISDPGLFDFVIESNDHIYNYGFTISYMDNLITSEWLYEITNDKKTCIFVRKQDTNLVTDLKIKNKAIKMRFEIYTEDVPNDKTMISEFVSHKLQGIEEFRPFFDVYSWFEELIIIFPDSIYSGYTQFITNDNKMNSLVKLLSYFDTGIEDITGDEKPIETVFEFLPENVRDELVEHLKTDFEGKSNVNGITADISVEDKRISISRKDDGTLVAHQLMMNHGNKDDLFNLEDESDGTRRLFDLIPIYGKALEERVILVDELDRSFHSKLTQEFLRKFYADNTNNKSQLIFTTHDLSLMSLSKFRQDEIWLIERQPDHSSKLQSFKFFRERFDKDISKEYLNGRYGAIPAFKD